MTTVADILPAVEDLRSWFESPEMALIALNGGYELTVRDRLLWPLQRRHSELRAWTEWADFSTTSRVDLALLDGAHPVYLCELKHNFSTQRGLFKRLAADVAKLKHLGCAKQFIHLVTTMEEGPERRKYRGHSIDPAAIAEHFHDLQAELDPGTQPKRLSFTAELDQPFRVRIGIDIWVLTQPAKIK